MFKYVIFFFFHEWFHYQSSLTKIFDSLRDKVNQREIKPGKFYVETLKNEKKIKKCTF